MKYTIFSIDDSRKAYTDKIERYLFNLGWTYLSKEKVNGSHAPSLRHNIARHGYEINFPDAKVGHLGIWYTVLNSFELAPHVTFEDDAILGSNFSLNWQMRFQQLPEDTDFFSLFLPRNQTHLYDKSYDVSSRLCRTYQTYGGVSMYYTERGVEKIKSLLARDGITGQYDDVLYAYSKAGELNGYCSKPHLSDLVYISGLEPSIVQESDYARISEVRQ